MMRIALAGCPGMTPGHISPAAIKRRTEDIVVFPHEAVITQVVA